MEQSILFAVVIILGLGAYWSLVIFPRQRDFQKRQRYVQTLREGDEMITFGGIVGRVVHIDTELGITHLEIAPGVIIRVISMSLMQPFDPAQLAENVQKAQRTGGDQT